MNDLKSELCALLNRYGQENGSNTPDFVLAEYLLACLGAFNAAVRRRDRWCGRHEEAPHGSHP